MSILRLSDIILPSFHNFHAVVKRGDYTHYVAKGGRNSSKSTTISIECILMLKKMDINGLVIRKVANTLQESVYEQLKEATIFLGIDHEFTFNKSPLRITYNEKGNYIIFRGADDPKKIKSIKTSNFPIGFVWYEELDEFKTEEEVQTINDSILRAELPDGMTYKFFYSYNPPKRKQHWLNKKYETQFIPPNTYVHHSTYLDNHHLPKQTLEDIKYTKEMNPKKYNWVYLGNPIGGGIVPFENLVFRKITEQEYKAFDNIYQGLDWGYASDPLAFVRWHYDKTRRKLYAMSEIYGVKLSNRIAAEKIVNGGYAGLPVVCDSAEPKSIDEIRQYGIKAIGAKKGPGSVEFGERWLDDLEEIVIDPERTPNIAREFEGIDYQVDNDGNIKNKLEDANNHCFVAGTMVTTKGGQVPIEDIKIDDLVLTRLGYKKVLKLFRNEKEVIKSPIGIVGTPYHQIITINGKKKYLKDLTDSDVLYFHDITQKGEICTKTVKHIKKMATDIIIDHSTMQSKKYLAKKQFRYIMKFGLKTEILFRKVITYIIKMATKKTTKLKIWNASQNQNTFPSTLSGGIKKTRISSLSILKKSDHLQKNGTHLRKERYGIQTIAKNIWLFLHTALKNVKSVMMNLKQRSQIIGFAVINVNQNTEGILALTMNKDFAPNVEIDLMPTNTARKKPVPSHAPESIGIQPVYNFMVEGQHEYFANNILVANSIDATRYALQDVMYHRAAQATLNPLPI